MNRNETCWFISLSPAKVTDIQTRRYTGLYSRSQAVLFTVNSAQYTS